MKQGEPVEENELGDPIALQGLRKFPVPCETHSASWVAFEQSMDKFQGGKIAVTKTTSE